METLYKGHTASIFLSPHRQSRSLSEHGEYDQDIGPLRSNRQKQDHTYAPGTSGEQLTEVLLSKNRKALMG